MSESLPDQPAAPTPRRGTSGHADENFSALEKALTAPFQLSQEPVTPEGQADAPADGAPPAPAYEFLGDLPATYGTQSLYLVAYDPRQLFAYWDVDWSALPGSTYSLHVHRAGGELENQVEISPAESGRYLPIGQPGGAYFVELGARGRDGQWRALAKSGHVTLPPEGIASEMEPKFATLPFHLSFQRLVELLQGALGPGETLTDALVRLQRGGAPGAASLLGALGGLSNEQMRTLELLLGRSLAPAADTGGSPGGESSGAFPAAGGRDLSSYGRIAAGGSETLSSGGFSSDTRLAASAGGSGTLSSGGFGSEFRAGAAAGGSGTLSSGGFGSESRLGLEAGGSETLSSGAMSSDFRFGRAAGGSETLSSGGFGSDTRLAGGSETLSSSGLSSYSRFAVGGSETLAAGALGMGSETLSSSALSSRGRWVGGEIGAGETLSSAGINLSSEAYAALAARGSEMLGSGAFSSRGGVPSSEAWRIASGSLGGGASDQFGSEQSSLFRFAVERNLDALGALFSDLARDLSSSGAGGSSSGSGSVSSYGGGSPSRW